MRYPDAIWRPTDKHGYGGFDTHSREGAVVHSMEGSLQAGFGVLDGPRQASWHFSIPKVGAPIYQHVDTGQIAWTNGSREANTKFWGIECEGGGPGHEGEPLTEPQFDALLGVLRWLWAAHQVGATVRQETWWEHNEMTRFGSAATSCPSGRIPWARLINEWEDAVTDAEFLAQFVRLMNAGELQPLIGKMRFNAADKNGQPTPAVATLVRWFGAFDDHRKDVVDHSPGEAGYTDAKAVKAVKDKL